LIHTNTSHFLPNPGKSQSVVVRISWCDTGKPQSYFLPLPGYREMNDDGIDKQKRGEKDKKIRK
jgi:hypothetical protein